MNMRLFPFLRTNRCPERYLYLVDGEKAYAGKIFRRLLWRLKIIQHPFLLTLLAFGIWIAGLFALFVLLAYRPDLPGIPEAIQWKVESPQQASSALAFREYLARVSGTIPQECAVTDQVVNLPVWRPDNPGDEPAKPLPGSVGLLRFFGIDDVPATNLDGEQVYYACSWRSDFGSLLAFASPSVGPVQKVTLLFLIIGILLVYRSRIQAEVDRAAFPGNDPLWTNILPGLRENWIQRRQQAPTIESPAELQKRLERGEHPVMYPVANRKFWTLYPESYLALDNEHDRHPGTSAYLEGVNSIRQEMKGAGPTDPFDLILEVNDIGIAAGRTGAANGMEGAVLEYRDRLEGRIRHPQYILWFLPTIGFLGTIYGISASLVRAKQLFASGGSDPDVFERNIQLVVDGLGVAFDTTSLALACAALLFFLLRRVEAGITVLTELARKSLHRLLIQRMVDLEELSRELPRGTSSGESEGEE